MLCDLTPFEDVQIRDKNVLISKVPKLSPAAFQTLAQVLPTHILTSIADLPKHVFKLRTIDRKWEWIQKHHYFSKASHLLITALFITIIIATALCCIYVNTSYKKAIAILSGLCCYLLCALYCNKIYGQGNENYLQGISGHLLLLATAPFIPLMNWNQEKELEYAHNRWSNKVNALYDAICSFFHKNEQTFINVSKDNPHLRQEFQQLKKFYS